MERKKFLNGLPFKSKILNWWNSLSKTKKYGILGFVGSIVAASIAVPIICAAVKSKKNNEESQVDEKQKTDLIEKHKEIVDKQNKIKEEQHALVKKIEEKEKQKRQQEEETKRLTKEKEELLQKEQNVKDQEVLNKLEEDKAKIAKQEQELRTKQAELEKAQKMLEDEQREKAEEQRKLEEEQKRLREEEKKRKAEEQRKLEEEEKWIRSFKIKKKISFNGLLEELNSKFNEYYSKFNKKILNFNANLVLYLIDDIVKDRKNQPEYKYFDYFQNCVNEYLFENVDREYNMYCSMATIHRGNALFININNDVTINLFEPIGDKPGYSDNVSKISLRILNDPFYSYVKFTNELKYNNKFYDSESYEKLKNKLFPSGKIEIKEV